MERGRLLEGEARRIFGELVVAVGTMHRKGAVHRDLKLENVLLDGECQVKLGDLGFAREWVRGQRLLETYCGTTGYASPEMLQGRKYAGSGECMGYVMDIEVTLKVLLLQRPTFGLWGLFSIRFSVEVYLSTMMMKRL